MAINIFQLSNNAEQNVYESFGYIKWQVEKEIKLLIDWIKTQTDLPEIMSK